MIERYDWAKTLVEKGGVRKGAVGTAFSPYNGKVTVQFGTYERGCEVEYDLTEVEKVDSLDA